MEDVVNSDAADARNPDVLARSADARHRRDRAGRRLAGRVARSTLGADVVCLVRDWVPQSELVRSGWIDAVRVVRGDVRDQALLERALGEYEIDTVIHLAAQTIVGIANRNPVSTFETQHQGTWALLEACRRSPLGEADRDRLVRQGVRRPVDDAAVRRGDAARRASIRTTSASRAPT